MHELCSRTILCIRKKYQNILKILIRFDTKKIRIFTNHIDICIINNLIKKILNKLNLILK